MNLKNDGNNCGRAAKVLRTLCSGVWWLALIIIGAMMLNIFSAKVKGRVPSVFGYSVLNIITGSMGEEIPAGSYILVKKIAPEEVKENDIICFYSTDPQIYGMPNTHRVVESPIVIDGKIEFVTQGDAAEKPDTNNAKGENLVGLYVGRIGWLEKLTFALDGGAMFAVIVALNGAIIAMICISAIRSKNKNGEDGESGDAQTAKSPENLQIDVSPDIVIEELVKSIERGELSIDDLKSQIASVGGDEPTRQSQKTEDTE